MRLLPLAAVALALLLAAGCEHNGAPPGQPTTDAVARARPVQAPEARAAVAVQAQLARPVADSLAPNSAVGAAQLSAVERSFVNDSSAVGLYEVAGGELAAIKASQPQVRAFGAVLASQHRAAQAELQALASARGITLPEQLAPDQRSKLERLARLSGAAFEREFIQVVGIADHEAAIARFSAAAREARDPQLLAWIDRTLPALQRNLLHAQQLALAR